jgi:ring-1,2-phenylacetyl-CoA epoxidase subunit PaaE
MGLLDLFKKKETIHSIPKGFFSLTLKNKIQLTKDSVKLVFEVPAELKSKFVFIPGQYVNIAATIHGKDIRRSYSICSGTHEDLAVGVKRIEKGVFSNYALNNLAIGDEIWVSEPMGNFQWKESANTSVAFAAGSGITPILSIAKTAQENKQNMKLFYGNKSIENVMFKDEIDALQDIQTTFSYTQDKVSDSLEGRFTKEFVYSILEGDSSLITADEFYICGPQEMVENVKNALIDKGVDSAKLHFELFTAAVDEKGATSSYQGKSNVTVICNQEEFHFEIDGKTNVLQKALDEDVDAPYSCRGGVCCTCKAKVLEGSAEMKINFTLTDEEINQGYILTCQAYATSPSLVISYDE